MGVEEMKNKENHDKHLASLPDITDEDWKARCVKRFQDRGGVTKEVAIDMAEACFEQRVDWDREGDPEGTADVEMSYWSE
ncbi:hypothetical protein [Pandoraea sp. PE-S2T-3]|uniref:hypothetical protein n=1 Tax=Pandoraea sp. PE-S2T-3 TaxID=1986993 RepID=UPI0020CCB011|nr:hypothetical protein [Pandoraea sp. PE-S2T-3]